MSTYKISQDSCSFKQSVSRDLFDEIPSSSANLFELWSLFVKSALRRLYTSIKIVPYPQLGLDRNDSVSAVRKVDFGQF